MSFSSTDILANIVYSAMDAYLRLGRQPLVILIPRNEWDLLRDEMKQERWRFPTAQVQPWDDSVIEVHTQVGNVRVLYMRQPNDSTQVG